MGMAAACRHRRATSRPSRWEVHWTVNPAIIISASTFRRDLAASSRSRRPTGKVVELKGPNGLPNGQRPGHRPGPAGLVHLQGRRAPRSPTRSRPPSFRSAQSMKKPWNFYYWPTKADSIHEPWAGGNARVDTMIHAQRRRPVDRRAGRLHPARRGHRPGRPQRPARDPAGRRRRRDLVPQPL